MLKRGAVAVLACFIAWGQSQVTLNQPPAKSPLTLGIERNQQYLQEFNGLLAQNEVDQKLVFTDLLADGSNLLSSNLLNTLKGMQGSEKAQQAAALLEKLTDKYSKFRDAGDTLDAIKNRDLNGEIVDLLKDTVDVVSSIPGCEECALLGKLSTGTDFALKKLELSKLEDEHARYQQVIDKLTEAQNLLISKDPVTRARLQAATEKALAAARAQQQRETDLLNQYYKDRARSIDLQVQNLTIVDPNQSTFDLSKIPGINPNFISALTSCNQALTDFIGKTDYYHSLLRNCPKPAKPDDPPPPCPGAGAAATSAREAEAAAINCNKSPDGSYVPAFLDNSSAGPSNQDSSDAQQTLLKAKEAYKTLLSEQQQLQTQSSEYQKQNQQALQESKRIVQVANDRAISNASASVGQRNAQSSNTAFTDNFWQSFSSALNGLSKAGQSAQLSRASSVPSGRPAVAGLQGCTGGSSEEIAACQMSQFLVSHGLAPAAPGQSWMRNTPVTQTTPSPSTLGPTGVKCQTDSKGRVWCTGTLPSWMK